MEEQISRPLPNVAAGGREVKPDENPLSQNRAAAAHPQPRNETRARIVPIVSVLDLIVRVVTAARLAGRAVSVCGDAGSHPTTLPLLIGAGVRAVSVACARIDETRYRLRRLDTTRCAQLFSDALRADDAEETAALVRERIEVPVP